MKTLFLSRSHRRSVRVPNTLAVCSAIILVITAMIQPASPPQGDPQMADSAPAREVSAPVGEPAAGAVTTDAATTRARPRFRISLMLFRSP